MILFLNIEGNVAPSKPMHLGHEDQSFPNALSFIVTDDKGFELAHYSTIIKSDRFADMPYNDLGAQSKTAISIIKSYAYRCDKIISDDAYYARVTVMNQMAADNIDWRKFDLIPYDSIIHMMKDHIKPVKGNSQFIFDAYEYCFNKKIDTKQSPYIFNYLRAMKDVYFWALNERMRNGNG